MSQQLAIPRTEKTRKQYGSEEVTRNGMKHLSVWIDAEALAVLDKIGKTEERKRSYLINKAVKEFAERHVAETEKAETPPKK